MSSVSVCLSCFAFVGTTLVAMHNIAIIKEKPEFILLQLKKYAKIDVLAMMP